MHSKRCLYMKKILTCTPPSIDLKVMLCTDFCSCQNEVIYIFS